MTLSGAEGNEAADDQVLKTTNGTLWLLDRMQRRCRSWLFELIYAPKLKSLGHFFVSGADHIGKQVIVYGERYEHELRLVLQRVLRRVGRGRSVALDVGANIGSHSTWMATEFDRVICVEPNTTLALVCEANLSVTKQTGWTVVNSALGMIGAKGALDVQDYSNLGATRVESTENDPGEISIRTGDSLLAELLDEDQEVGLIKIDVEGDELAVVMGLLDTIRKNKPILAIECLNRDRWSQIEHALRRVGYKEFLVPRKRRTAKSVRSFLATMVLGQEICLVGVADGFNPKGEPMIICLADVLDGLRLSATNEPIEATSQT